MEKKTRKHENDYKDNSRNIKVFHSRNGTYLAYILHKYTRVCIKHIILFLFVVRYRFMFCVIRVPTFKWYKIDQLGGYTICLKKLHHISTCPFNIIMICLSRFFLNEAIFKMATVYLILLEKNFFLPFLLKKIYIVIISYCWKGSYQGCRFRIHTIPACWF